MITPKIPHNIPSMNTKIKSGYNLSTVGFTVIRGSSYYRYINLLKIMHTHPV